jgi:hypothetical protein
MTRLLFAIGLTVGIVIGYRAGKRKRQPVSPCPEYKVYGEREVTELETQANVRKAIKGLST